MAPARFDPHIFKDAADTISRIKAGEKDVDLSPVTKASEYMCGYGKTLEEFLLQDPVTRCLLWTGARFVSKKSRNESELFSVIREMIGSSRNILKANGKLDRTHLFFTELGSIGH